MVFERNCTRVDQMFRNYFGQLTFNKAVSSDEGQEIEKGCLGVGKTVVINDVYFFSKNKLYSRMIGHAQTLSEKDSASVYMKSEDTAHVSGIFFIFNWLQAADNFHPQLLQLKKLLNEQRNGGTIMALLKRSVRLDMRQKALCAYKPRDGGKGNRMRQRSGIF